jgi:hypothetical protein
MGWDVWEYWDTFLSYCPEVRWTITWGQVRWNKKEGRSKLKPIKLADGYSDTKGLQKSKSKTQNLTQSQKEPSECRVYILNDENTNIDIYTHVWASLVSEWSLTLPGMTLSYLNA